MYIDIDGIKIHYLVKGKGKDAIFITGVFGDIKRYDEIINILSKKYRVWAFDLPLHGKSGKLKKGFSLDGLVNLTSEPPNVLYNKFRAYAFWPRIFFFQNSRRIIITDASLENNKFIIKKVLPEGKKEIKYEEFKKINI